MSPPSPRAALLLTAGLGQRLTPLTRVRAKPAVPLAGEPIVRRIGRWLVGAGVTDLVLNLHHRPETIAAVMGDGSDIGARVRYSWEQPIVLGGAGGARKALSILGDGPFLIVNGDTLTDFDVRALTTHHVRTGALITLALTPNREPQRYGGVHLDSNGHVVGFARRGPEAQGSFHFVGLQIADAEAFASLAVDRPAASIGGAYDALIEARPGSIVGLVCDPVAFWDIGTVADYWTTSHAWMARDAAGAPPGRGTRVAPTARVSRSILWDDIQIEGGCVLDECIVTDGVRVPAGATYRRSILLPDGAGGVECAPLGFDPS